MILCPYCKQTHGTRRVGPISVALCPPIRVISVAPTNFSAEQRYAYFGEEATS